MSLVRLLVFFCLLSVALAGCSKPSPNRGTWEGSFDGDASGTVVFTINAKGTEVRGEMEGETSGGQTFRAKIKGTLRIDFIDAAFEGTVQATPTVPVGFTGNMTGELAAGEGTGDWQCALEIPKILGPSAGALGQGLEGTWTVRLKQDS